MKVSAEQINRLYDFTRQHYVEYYDLQTELVDHLANAIEAQWSENPKLSFEEALQTEFKKFGVFGFMDVVEKRQAAMNLKYHKLVWKHFKTFFKIPQIIGTVVSMGIIYLILKIVPYVEDVIFGILVLIFLVFITGFFINKNRIGKDDKVTGKKWLFKEVIFSYGYSFLYMQLPIQLSIHVNRYSISEPGIFLSSFLITALLLFEYIMLVIIPSKAEKYLKETYPEYHR